MTPDQLEEAINKQNPMMHEDFAKQFVGVPVDWILDFASASTRERNGERYILVLLLPPEKTHPLVMGRLPADRVGELKTVARGEKIRIKGTIGTFEYGPVIFVDLSEFTILRN